MKFLNEAGLNTFWEKIKRYFNGLLSPVEQKITEIESAIKTINSDIKTIQSSIQTINSNIGGINSNIDGVKSDMEDIKSDVKTNTDDIAILNDAVFPYSLTSSISDGNIREKGKTFNIVVNWTMKKGTDVITPTEVKINNSPVSAEELSASKKTFNSVSTNTTYNISAKHNNKEKTSSVTVSFFSASYYGKTNMNINNITADEIRTKTKSIKSNKNANFTNKYTNERAVYAYPKSFGLVSTIKDANGFSYTIGSVGQNASFIYKELVVDNKESYYVYMSNDVINNAANITFIFS